MKALVLALLSAYVSGEISVAEFKTWFIPATWDMSRITDPELAAMIRRVQLLLMEFSGGDRTEEELKVQLRSFVSWSQRVDVGSHPSITSRLNMKSTTGSKHQVVEVAA
jgi:hypothetical protein